MPKQLLNMPSFEGGLNTALDPRDIALSELSRANNVMCDVNGIITLQGKATSHSLSNSPGQKIVPGYGFFRFESSFGGGQEGSSTIGAYASTGIYTHEDVGSEYTKEGVWYIISDGFENIYAKIALAAGSWTNIGKINTENADLDVLTFKSIYHIADEGLRISNASYDSSPDDFPGTQLIKNRWFGFIKKRKYFRSDPSGSDYYFNGWYFLDNDIKAPTSFKVSTSLNGVGFATNHIADADPGIGFDLYIASDTGGEHDFSLDAEGTTVTYEFASSFIYDGMQESLLNEESGAGTGHVVVKRVGTADAADDVDLSGDGTLKMVVGVATGYNPRITGGRIYFRKYQSNNEWVLLVDIDFEKGCRSSLDDTYPGIPWTEEGSGNEEEDIYSSTSGATDGEPDDPIVSTFLNVDSYYTLNEWSPSEPRISIGCNNTDNTVNSYPTNAEGMQAGEGYKCSAVVGRRCFIANTALYKSEDSNHVATGDLFRERDRIYYSAANKFDCFPRTTHYIDVVRGDAEEYTALVGYADRLLAFKTNTLYIINVAAQDPREWFLESQHKGMGVKKPCQTVNTEDGVMWANGRGAYVYTGGDVRTTTTEDVTIGADINNIAKGKISSTDWIVDTGFIGVSYIERKRQFLVIENLNFGGDKNFVYDFDSKTWTGSDVNSSTFEPLAGEISNFITDGNGELVFASRSMEEASSELIPNGNFIQDNLSDGDDFYNNGDNPGSVDGVTITNIDGSGTPFCYILDNNLHVEKEHTQQDEAWYQKIKIEYTTPTALEDGTTYTINTSYFAYPEQIQITLAVKPNLASTYETIAGEQMTNEGAGSFSEEFVASSDQVYNIKFEFTAEHDSDIHWYLNYLSLIDQGIPSETIFFKFNNVNFIDGALGSSRFNIAKNGIDIRTKDIDFGQPGVKKKVYAIYITHRTPTGSSTQTTPVSYVTDGGTSFTNLTGNITATGGAWTVSKFYSATPIECQSIRFKVTNPSAAGMLEINDMAIEHRQIHKRVA